jgi:hypothetical protein
MINKTSNDEIEKKKNESTMLTRQIYNLIHETEITS